MISSTIPGYQSGVDPYAPKNATSTDDDLGMESFLNLLMVQLQHQDPLNPMEDQDFTAQLAQFSSLEQLEGIKTGVDGLNEGALRQDMLGAVGFIGRDVLAYGSSISKQGNETTVASYELEQNVSKLFLNVYDSNGVMVHSENLGARQAGTYQFHWDGKDYNGSEQVDGVYSVAISAEDVEGQPVFVNTEVSGRVASVFNTNGLPQLRLSDGRQVGFYDVKEIVDVTKDSHGDGGTSTDSGSGDTGNNSSQTDSNG